MIASRRFTRELGYLLAGFGLAVACGGGGEGEGQPTQTSASAGGATTTVSTTDSTTNTSSTPSSSTASSSDDTTGSTSAATTVGTTGSTSAGGASGVSTTANVGGSSTATGGAAAVSSSDDTNTNTNTNTSASGGTTGAGGSGMAGCDGGGGAPSIIAAHSGAWRIMPLGDSITETTCYPQLLSKNLIDAGHTNFEFVGSVLNNQSCGATNVDTEGHGGYLVTDLVGGGPNASEPAGWFSAGQAEVVVMHFGTNDVWNNRSAAEITAAYSELVTGLRAVNPNVITFVAQIIDMNPDGCAECSSRVQTLNAAIPAWASAESTCDSPIYVVDLFAGFDTANDTNDGVHPNTGGSQKMADTMSAALVEVGIP